MECDEPHYVRATYNEEMEQVERSISTADGLEPCEKYYWIKSDDREDVLAVDNFMEAEKILIGLKEGEYEDFEQAVEEHSAVAEIQENRPPF
ncbi:hypothetical protein [Haloarcula vallismortis]|uniref:hypothetical protein n=1 Tax=Haloarcula vallismortis TaxID=28442 RepID=UPI0011142F45|nr:hypothetical protein [Haloarcula vallismortis]